MGMLATTRSVNPALATCTASTCSASSNSGSSQPSEVTTTLISHVHYPSSFNPSTFDINIYIEATKAALGVSTAPEALVKVWEIFVSYLVPAGADMAALKTAIATANSVEESAITLTAPARRLGQGRRLNTQVDVKIVTPDAAAAQAVKMSAASVDALTTELGGAVTVKAGSEPKAAAVIETVVKSDASQAGNLQDLITGAEAAVGGTIKAEVSTNNPGPQTESRSSASSSSITLAMLVLLRIVM